ncbi:lipase family protein [Nocardia sp. NPDC060249]|uniref:lipase family protein n=1 Tax=Nocardia sp. NPDC060249 TaxID=3347082 RepID=UPI003667035B
MNQLARPRCRRRFLAAALAVAGLTFVATPAHADDRALPGTVVATSPLADDLQLNGSDRGLRLTYWTQDSTGRAAQSSGAVFTPRGAAPPHGWPVVSWLHGTVGLGDDCAPSTAGPTDRDRDFTYLNAWLNHGYAVVATDYIGLGTPGVHAFLDGAAEAHAAIDIVRAARTIDSSLSTSWLAVGQSQGGGGALWTATMATKYAPELDYRGVIATAPAAQVVSLLAAAGPSVPNLGMPNLTVYTAYAMRGLKQARPDWDLDSYLTPLGRRLVDDAETLCFRAMAERVEEIGVGELLMRSLSEGDFAERAHEVFDAPMAPYDRPVFIGQGAIDKTVPLPLTLAFITQLRVNGTFPALRVYPGSDHGGTVVAATIDAIRFAEAVTR